MSPCPCGSSYLATDTLTEGGTAIMCCDCKAMGPRGLNAKQAESLWNDWAESQAEQLDPLGQVIHN